ncbi:FecR family protein [Chitinophaga barathri]|uniref:DUF4974 domain-containing protein n=1 Tax=Chitinophaga barathri TaxID=1647451 RepID=A0A3N4MD52_9BACT|nr:FecR family protein [Chitinophaga barathri]RPD39856.1 DUF4974 domain-containing protein [Chitinophaga barathri]
MNSEQQRLKQLLSSGAQTDADEQWLLSYLETTDATGLRELAATLFQQELAEGARIEPASSRRLWDRIQERLEEGQPVPEAFQHPQPQPVRPPKSRIALYWQAAAAVLLIAGSVYLWQHTAPEKTPVASRDIVPGSNKAMLTLSDGRTVPLNDTAEQAITAGIHQRKGQLEYNGDETANGIQYNVLTTPRGGRFSVTLPDGSIAWLNAASSLKYPTRFSGTRKVELTGQGYFEIAPGTTPFVVTANGAEVQVLGTHFDVMAYADEPALNITLLEGAVAVKNSSHKKQLRPGQQAVLSPVTGGMEVQEADVEKTMAWKNGLFELENTDLPALMRQLSRWYDVEIVDESGGKNTKHFGGRVGRDMQLADVLKILEQYDVHCRIEGRTITILSK